MEFPIESISIICHAGNGLYVDIKGTMYIQVYVHKTVPTGTA